MQTCGGVSRRAYCIDNTYRQQTSPHCGLEPSDFGTPSADAFVKVDHDRPQILDMLQTLCDLLQSRHVVWSRKYTYEAMTVPNYVEINARSEEDLL